MSFAFMMYNFLGLLPSKFIYGFVYDSGTGHNSEVAMATIMFSPIVPVLDYYLVGYLIIHNDVLGYEERKSSACCSRCCKMRCCRRFSICCTSSVLKNEIQIRIFGQIENSVCFFLLIKNLKHILSNCKF